MPTLRCIVFHEQKEATSAFSCACRPCEYKAKDLFKIQVIVQELCESRGGRPGLSVLTSLLVSVDVKLY